MSSENGLYELPNEWEWVTVGDISKTIHYGYTASASKDIGNVKLLRITDIQNNSVNWDLVPYCNIENSKKEQYLLKKGDLVFARTGATVGKSYLIKGYLPDSIFASYLIRIIILADINKNFIYNFFQSSHYWKQIHEGKLGIGQPNVNAQILSKITLPLPPLEEQKRIVAKIEELFTELDAGVELLKKLQIKLKRYRQSVLKAAVEGNLTQEWREENQDKLEPANQLLDRILKERREKWEAEQLAKFTAQGKNPKDDSWKLKYQEPSSPDISNLPTLPNGWCWINLDLIADIIDPQPSHRTPPIVNDGIPYIGIGDIKNGKINLENARKVSPQVLSEQQQRYQLKLGDFFFGKIGTLGKPVKLTSPFNYALSANVVLIQSNINFINPSLVFSYMESPLVKNLLAKESRATTQAAFGIQKVRLISFPLPSLSEQSKIVEEIELRLSVIDQIETIIETNLKRSEKLRQSILKQAFQGKLVEQDPNDEPAAKLLERIKAEKAKEEPKRVSKRKPKETTKPNKEKES